jgi:hypothetical protein
VLAAPRPCAIIAAAKVSTGAVYVYGYDYHRITPFHLVWLLVVAVGATLGGMVGQRYLGTVGAVAGAVIGLLIGHIVVGVLHGEADRRWFRKLKQSSNAQLWSIVAADGWKFCHTIALLHLAARDEEVHRELPRIIGMLESDSRLTRAYGWDALRTVFSKETKIIEDYNPRESTEECRRKTAILKATLEQESHPTPTADHTSSSDRS